MKPYPKIPYSFCSECRFAHICPTLNDSYEAILDQTRNETAQKFGEILTDERLSAKERLEKIDRIMTIISYYDAQAKYIHEWE